MSSKPTVIVAGAGPVGLSLALFVARAGIPVTVLEKRKDVNRQSKASTFHAPTLDILGQLGVADQMVADAWLALPDDERARLAPCFASFDPTDLAEALRTDRSVFPVLWLAAFR